MTCNKVLPTFIFQINAVLIAIFYSSKSPDKMYHSFHKSIKHCFQFNNKKKYLLSSKSSY